MRRQKVNANLFALKYAWIEILKESLEKDKRKIKEGAKITFNSTYGIKTRDCKKHTLDKDKVQALCDKYNEDITKLENTTEYTQVTIRNVPKSTVNKINNIFNILLDIDTKDELTTTLINEVLEK